VRRIFVAGTSLLAAIGGFGACSSFDESDAVVPPNAEAGSDALASDAPADDDASTRAEAGSFCASRKDAGVFCFDFDTEPLQPTWNPFQYFDAGGVTTITVDDGAFTSSPKSAFLSIKQPNANAGATSAAIKRLLVQDVAAADFDFDVAVLTNTQGTTLFYVFLLDSQGNVHCAFGLNAAPPATATLIATKRVDGGGTFISEDRPETFPQGFAHVHLTWTSSPPEVRANIAGFDLDPLLTPDCVPSQRVEVAFGPQSPGSPVEASMRFDSIVYAFR
jgi:hypothetical protein